MNSKVVFYITRHGETIYNTMNKVQGWADSPLTDSGVRIAELVGNNLKGTKFAAAYSSDSSRAIKTAEIILNESNNTDIELVHDLRLREWCFGILEGQSNKDLLSIILKEIPNVSFNELNCMLPEVSESIVKYDETGWAEDFKTIKNRLESVFNDIAKKVLADGGGNVLVVTHAFFIKTILHTFSYDHLKNISKIENGSITKLVYENGKFEVIDVNNLK